MYDHSIPHVVKEILLARVCMQNGDSIMRPDLYMGGYGHMRLEIKSIMGLGRRRLCMYRNLVDKDVVSSDLPRTESWHLQSVEKTNYHMNTTITFMIDAAIDH